MEEGRAKVKGEGQSKNVYCWHVGKVTLPANWQFIVVLPNKNHPPELWSALTITVEVDQEQLVAGVQCVTMAMYVNIHDFCVTNN